MSAVIAPAVAEAGMTADGREAEVCALLVARGRLKDSDLGRARRLHEESVEGTLTTLMARLGLVSERDLAEAWAELLQVPLLAARDAPELPPADLELSLRFLKQQHVVPVYDEQHGLALIVADPADPYPRQAVELAAGRPVALRVGLRSEIAGLIERYTAAAVRRWAPSWRTSTAARPRRTTSSTCAIWPPRLRSSGW